MSTDQNKQPCTDPYDNRRESRMENKIFVSKTLTADYADGADAPGLPPFICAIRVICGQKRLGRGFGCGSAALGRSVRSVVKMPVRKLDLFTMSLGLQGI